MRNQNPLLAARPVSGPDPFVAGQVITCSLVEGTCGRNALVLLAGLCVGPIADPGPKLSLAMTANEVTLAVNRAGIWVPGTFAKPAWDHLFHDSTLP